MTEKKLAEEFAQPNETKLISEMTDVIIESLNKKYGSKQHERRFHAKSTGLAKGKFIINPNLPPKLQQGIFKTAGTFDCLVRFSNGATVIDNDQKRGIRGMAIKLLNVGQLPGDTDNDAVIQDFVLTNNPILFPGTLQSQHAALFTLYKNWHHFLPLLVPLRLWGLSRFLGSMVSPASPLNLTYHSGTPYLFGTGNAVKWMVSPFQLSESNKNTGENFLRDNLRQELLDDEFHFNFSIQLQEHPVRQPIEDSSIRWRTPKVNVASLILSRQDIDDIKMQDERISFDPWHCVSEHRPLGGPNRFRKVYSELAHRRHLHNHSAAPHQTK